MAKEKAKNLTPPTTTDMLSSSDHPKFEPTRSVASPAAGNAHWKHCPSSLPQFPLDIGLGPTIGATNKYFGDLPSLAAAAIAAAAIAATAVYQDNEQLLDSNEIEDGFLVSEYTGSDDFYDHAEPTPSVNGTSSPSLLVDPDAPEDTPDTSPPSPGTVTLEQFQPPTPPRTPTNTYQYCSADASCDQRYRAARGIHKAQDQIRHAREDLYDSQATPRTPCPPAFGRRAPVNWAWNRKAVSLFGFRRYILIADATHSVLIREG